MQQSTTTSRKLGMPSDATRANRRSLCLCVAGSELSIAALPRRRAPDERVAGDQPMPQCRWQQCQSEERWRRTCSACTTRRSGQGHVQLHPTGVAAVEHTTIMLHPTLSQSAMFDTAVEYSCDCSPCPRQLAAWSALLPCARQTAEPAASVEAKCFTHIAQCCWTAHLPLSSTTIFPDRWLSTNSNSPMYPASGWQRCRKAGALQQNCRSDMMTWCIAAMPAIAAPLTVLHHQRQELDEHLAGRAQQHLLLAALLGIVHRLLQAAKPSAAQQARQSRVINRAHGARSQY